MSDAHRDEITKLEALYAENPEGRIFTHLAEAYRKAGELERAHEVLEEGIGRHPDYSSAHVVLGRVLVDRDRPDEAEAEFRRVLELDPHNMIAIRSLADLARTRGDDAEALEYYNRLLEVEPSDDEARAIVEEMTTGVPATGESVAGEEEARPADEAPWGGESGWGEPADETIVADELDGDEVPLDALEADEPVDSPRTGAGPEPDEGPDDFDDAPWRTDAPEPSASDLEWIGGTELPERDDGIASEMETEEWQPEEELRGDADEQESAGQDVGDGELAGRQFGEEDTEVRTETIAQVYARQGLYDRAAEVYRELVRTRPDDDRLRDRLAEMEQLADRTGEDETAAVEGFSADTGEDALDEALDEAPWASQPIESEEEIVEPEPYTVEGLQTTDFDTADVEATSVAGLEVDETDPDTGLRSDTLTPAGDADPDVAGAEDEPETETGEEPPSEESIWTAGDWGGDEADITPHAWTDEEAEEDRSSPIRSYFGRLLEWPETAPGEGDGDTTPAGTQPADDVRADRPAGGPDEAPADVPADDAVDAPAVGGPESAPPKKPVDREGDSDDDDDLDMFRSWLESLKQ